ncbi:hypothetical protein QBC46DRAFT_276617 [Diplogelasinospora grovesii]|uniref:Kinetoplast-associated protein KAP n=1 Tax=Diplogelasinospora grovesii TaxID=303347 RepID=A0AAN6NJA2_9PEZI|nr:hypothetical protein QBC46DRAFT_276617 [Diplogelasinospora grovesii]
MAIPLSPAPSTVLNFSTPPTTASRRYESSLYEVKTYSTATTTISANAQLSSSMENIENELIEGDSSPFMSHVKDDNELQSPRDSGVILSPTKAFAAGATARPQSRIISGSELSPLKILQSQKPQQQEPEQNAKGDESLCSSTNSMPPPPAPLSAPQRPRKMSSPIKRFPVKVSAAPGVMAAVEQTASRRTSTEPQQERQERQERQVALQDVMRDNEGLKHAIEIFEDEVSVIENDNEQQPQIGNNSGVGEEDDDTLLMGDQEQIQHQEQEQDHDRDQIYEDEDERSGFDDTMISTFSTFSSVPNLTMLAQMRSNTNSPNKFSTLGGATPRAAAKTPRTSQNGPLPNRMAQYDSSGNTTNLLDFTEQLRHGEYQQTPSRNGRLSPSKTTSNVINGGGRATVASTPQRNNLVNLLDFDIPPLPTPRSIPTITPRELESLKSGFLSEISSLKASLSGKEAEVLSLKTAVGDAEKRVGECLEQLREVQSVQETLTVERDSWEKRGREMEAVLRKVKEEIVLGQREREELEFKLDEAEKRREAAEMMAQEAESKMAGMRAGKASAEAAAADNADNRVKSPTTVGSNKEVEIAVERVARELHALYKSKHETKVAALKKSYENRWEKKVRELENQVDELARDNEELRNGRNATMTRVDGARAQLLSEEKAKDAAQIRELEAEVEKLEAVVKTVQGDNAELRVLLERERVEKGELVMLAEEMMSMQQSFIADQTVTNVSVPAAAVSSPNKTSSGNNNTAKTPARPAAGRLNSTTPSTVRHAPAGESNFRGSIIGAPRASGLRAPGGLKSSATESRIGRGPAAHERTKSSASTGLQRPGSGLSMRPGGGAGGIMSSIEKMGSYRGRGD